MINEVNQRFIWPFLYELFSSVQFSRSVMSNSLRPHGLQHTRAPCPSPTLGIYPNSCPLSWWCSPTISSSVVPFSFRLQFFPTSGSFPMSQLFASGGQVLELQLQHQSFQWTPKTDILLGLTGWISLKSKGILWVFSNTTFQKHQFFCHQLSL